MRPPACWESLAQLSLRATPVPWWRSLWTGVCGMRRFAARGELRATQRLPQRSARRAHVAGVEARPSPGAALRRGRRSRRRHRRRQRVARGFHVLPRGARGSQPAAALGLGLPRGPAWPRAALARAHLARTRWPQQARSARAAPSGLALAARAAARLRIPAAAVVRPAAARACGTRAPRVRGPCGLNRPRPLCGAPSPRGRMRRWMGMAACGGRRSCWGATGCRTSARAAVQRAARSPGRQPQFR